MTQKSEERKFLEFRSELQEYFCFETNKKNTKAVIASLILIFGILHALFENHRS